MRRHHALTTVIAVGALAVFAGPAFGAATAVDGPSAAVVQPQTIPIDVAPDGTAAVAYLKAEAGKDHVFVAIRSNGVWSAPQRVDTGILPDNPSRRVSVAVANGGKVVVTFVNAPALNPFGNLYGAIKPNAATAFQAAALINGNTAAFYARVKLAPGGNGYAAIGTSGNAGNDVRASRLVGTTWTAVGDVYPNVPGKLNNDPGKIAGPADSQREVRLAVNGDGSAATLVWSEGDGAATNDTFVRRLTGTATTDIGSALQASLVAGTMVGGFPATTDSQVPDIDVYGDNAWVVFRQSIAYGVPINDKPRLFARRLTGGSLDPIQLIDGLGSPPGGDQGVEFPRVALNANGQGIVAAARQTINDTLGGTLSGGTWAPAVNVNATTNGTVPSPVPVITDAGSGAIAWLFDPGGGANFQVRVRTRVGVGAFDGETTLSRADLGSVLGTGLEIAADASGNGYAAFLQGSATPAQPRSIVVADVPLPAPAVVNPAPPEPTFDTTDPVTTKASVTPRTFRLGTALPGLVAASVKTSAISFTLSEAGRVRFSFERATTGRKVGRRCLAATRARRKRARCTRYVALKTSITVNAPAGVNRLRFQGRLTRKVTLSPATYRVTITATDAAGNLSREVRTTFKLLPKLKPKPRRR